MANKLFWFPTPSTLSPLTLQPDPDPAQGLTFPPIPAKPDTHSTGRPGVSFTIPSNVSNSRGAALVGPSNWSPKQIRGILILSGDDSFLRVDDVHYTEDKICPEPPIPPIPPPHAKDPLSIINAVYATGHFNLATKEGCGQFTEACVTALHLEHSTAWGHIQKFPPQNHYPEVPYVPGGKVHAVDAIMLLVAMSDAQAGIYDIVVDSESPNAKPAFNFSGPPNPALWYYPA